jgi:hypothetical protein
MIEFRAGTNDLNLENYANLLVPEGWMFAVENVPMAHFHDVKTPHGEISPGPCRCLTIGSIRWWTEDLRYTVEYFTFGFDHPSPSEDVGWDLTTRREGPPPESFTFEGDWDSPVGTGYGPLHGPAAVTIFRGDFDGDYDVDGADFLAWQRGEVSNPPSAEDLALWQTQFGTTSPSTATTVLEPTTLLLAMLGMAGACCWRRNR